MWNLAVNVLGSRAGRDKYEQIVAAARKAQDHPVVTQVQDKAKELLSSAKAASSTDTSIDPDAASATATTGSKARSARRQPQSSVTAPDLATDPLA